MNKMNRKWTLTLAAALVGATVLLNAQAWAGKNPPPPTPTPKPLPNVQYNIKWLNVMTAQAMNDFGHVVGSHHDLDGHVSAFLYTPETGVKDLNEFIDPNDGVRLTHGMGINNHGQIVGKSNSGGYRFTPSFTNDQNIPVPSVVEVLGPPLAGLDYGDPQGINDFGDVVVSGYKPGTPSGTTQAFIYDRNSYWIGPLTTTGVPQLAINNYMQVVGMDYRIVNKVGVYSAFRWSPAVKLQLFGSGVAYDINDAGQFVGQAAAGRAFRYTDGVGMVSLGTLGETSHGDRINNLGQVVGQYITRVKVQGIYQMYVFEFLYTDASGMVDLDMLVSGATEDLAKWLSATSIAVCTITTPRLADGTVDPDGFGQICGNAFFTDAAGNSYTEGVLLTPQFKQR